MNCTDSDFVYHTAIVVLYCSETRELSPRSWMAQGVDVEDYIIKSVDPMNIRHNLRYRFFIQKFIYFFHYLFSIGSGTFFYTEI